MGNGGQGGDKLKQGDREAGDIPGYRTLKYFIRYAVRQRALEYNMGERSHGKGRQQLQGVQPYELSALFTELIGPSKW